MANAFHRLDADLYRRAHATDTPPAVDTALTALSRAANHSKLWLGVAALLATQGRPGRRAALRGVMSIGLASAVANLPAKHLSRRKRPDALALVRAGRLPRRIPSSGSFPSGHSASAAAFAVGAASELPGLAVPLGAAAVAVGYSRVHTGVHYPGDVVAGWALGAAVGVATRWWWPLAPVDPDAVRERVAPTATSPAPGGRGVTIAVNAAAGPGDTAADDVVAELRSALPEAEVVPLDDPEHLAKTLEAAAPDAVAIGVHGGDGSVNAAAAVAYDARKPLVVVPGGTLNHLARDLGVEGVADAAAAVENGWTLDMDVAEIDGRPFLNTASFGSYADLVDARERLENRIGKWPALLVALVTVLRRDEPVEAEVDGVRRRIWAIFVGNGEYRPAGFAPAYRPRLDDGLLDVRVLYGGRLLPRYVRWTAREVRVRVDGPVRLARDGETFDGSREFTIRKRPRRLRVYAPRAG
ncbi:MAG: hypothetical protein QOE45_2529 [Frankiaceae bacterium]|jgi:undecaprenyl-diphosphatase|nr:hypothetical protein [Frankiaceae bacterium]